jgi:hypothetical protein
MSEEDFDIPGELVEKKRREGKKDHSRDKKQVDELERKKANLHKRRIAELQEEDLDDDEEEYRHLWK